MSGIKPAQVTAGCSQTHSQQAHHIQRSAAQRVVTHLAFEVYGFININAAQLRVSVSKLGRGKYNARAPIHLKNDAQLRVFLEKRVECQPLLTLLLPWSLFLTLWLLLLICSSSFPRHSKSSKHSHLHLQSSGSWEYDMRGLIKSHLLPPPRHLQSDARLPLQSRLPDETLLLVISFPPPRVRPSCQRALTPR